MALVARIWKRREHAGPGACRRRNRAGRASTLGNPELWMRGACKLRVSRPIFAPPRSPILERPRTITLRNDGLLASFSGLLSDARGDSRYLDVPTGLMLAYGHTKKI